MRRWQLAPGAISTSRLATTASYCGAVLQAAQYGIGSGLDGARGQMARAVGEFGLAPRFEREASLQVARDTVHQADARLRVGGERDRDGLQELVATVERDRRGELVENFDCVVGYPTRLRRGPDPNERMFRFASARRRSALGWLQLLDWPMRLSRGLFSTRPAQLGRPRARSASRRETEAGSSGV